MIYKASVLEQEKKLADMIAAQVKYRCDCISSVQGSIDSHQFEAVRKACRNNLSILRGLPGTGKTTSLKQVIASYSKAGMKGAVVSPTGKASKRADEVISPLAALGVENVPRCITAHRLLGFSSGKFIQGEDNKLDIDYLVVDETSMVGFNLAFGLFSAIDPKRTRVVLCGDNNQLPSVDPGAVFRDVIYSECIPDTYLTKIYRQGKDSGIVRNASRMLDGKAMTTQGENNESYNDFFIASKRVPITSFEYIVDCVCRLIPEKRKYDRLTGIQVLSPGRKGEVGTQAINDKLMKELNPGRKPAYYGFSKGDKVINRSNNYELGIVNGDVGIVVESGKSGIIVDFGPGAGADGKGIVTMSGESGKNLRFAYAFTVHSSQGSEFDCVIVVLHRTHYILLERTMLYTAITRGKKMTLVVGDPSCMTRCVKNDSAGKRMTGLKRMLQERLK